MSSVHILHSKMVQCQNHSYQTRSTPDSVTGKISLCRPRHQNALNRALRGRGSIDDGGSWPNPLACQNRGHCYRADINANEGQLTSRRRACPRRSTLRSSAPAPDCDQMSSPKSTDGTKMGNTHETSRWTGGESGCKSDGDGEPGGG